MLSVIPGTPILGSRRLYEILFREVFGTRAVVPQKDVRAYCLARMYRVGAELDGALLLLINIHALVSDGDSMRPGTSFEQISEGRDLGLSLSESLITELRNADEISEIFGGGSLSWGEKSGEVYVHGSQIPFRYLPVIGLLRELGALRETEEQDTLLRALPPISQLLVASIFEASERRRPAEGMSPEELLELQKANAAQGEAAEEFVLNYERTRLIGHQRLSLVRRISLENVAAGYDIISFDSPKSVVPDRFIEVKSFRTTEQFFFSAGEAVIAAKLKDRYFIYIVDAEASKQPDYQPRIVQNPMTTIFSSDSHWSVVPSVWQISRR
jgi:Domain of unknown function (DUF3883)